MTHSPEHPQAPRVPSPEEPLPDVKPARLWYWVGGAIFPVNLLISVLLLSDNPEASPALIVGGILTPMLTFMVSLVICVAVFIIRGSKLSRLRIERARRAHTAGYPLPHPGQPVQGQQAQAYQAWAAGQAQAQWQAPPQHHPTDQGPYQR